jgi:hypothetical protein
MMEEQLKELQEEVQVLRAKLEKKARLQEQAVRAAGSRPITTRAEAMHEVLLVNDHISVRSACCAAPSCAPVDRGHQACSGATEQG